MQCTCLWPQDFTLVAFSLYACGRTQGWQQFHGEWQPPKQPDQAPQPAPASQGPSHAHPHPTPANPHHAGGEDKGGPSQPPEGKIPHAHGEGPAAAPPAPLQVPHAFFALPCILRLFLVGLAQGLLCCSLIADMIVSQKLCPLCRFL